MLTVKPCPVDILFFAGLWCALMRGGSELSTYTAPGALRPYGLVVDPSSGGVVVTGDTTDSLDGQTAQSSDCFAIRLPVDLSTPTWSVCSAKISAAIVVKTFEPKNVCHNRAGPT